jgi:hypothetical protein
MTYELELLLEVERHGAECSAAGVSRVKGRTDWLPEHALRVDAWKWAPRLSGRQGVRGQMQVNVPRHGRVGRGAGK